MMTGATWPWKPELYHVQDTYLAPDATVAENDNLSDPDKGKGRTDSTKVEPAWMLRHNTGRPHGASRGGSWSQCDRLS